MFEFHFTIFIKILFSYRISSEKPAKTKQLADKAVQTTEEIEYWKKLAEEHEELLNDSLQEKETLKDTIEALQDENKICKEMLDESKTLVEVLQVCLVVL